MIAVEEGETRRRGKVRIFPDRTKTLRYTFQVWYCSRTDLWRDLETGAEGANPDLPGESLRQKDRGRDGFSYDSRRAWCLVAFRGQTSGLTSFCSYSYL